MKNFNTKKLALAALFVAISVVGSTLYIPVFGSKCAPVQHCVNVLSAIFLGPWIGLLTAFTSSLIRNMLGLGTLLAFPGSCFGVFLSGILYQKSKKLIYAYLGEIFGTGIIGGITAYPIAAFILGNKAVALFTFVIPFLISTVGGVIVSIFITLALQKSGFIAKTQRELNK